MGLGHERHTGRVGDRYRVDAEAVEYAKRRRGTCDYIELQPGDVLMRTHHSGDCFSTYAVIRDGQRVGEWCGYDGVGEYIDNAVDTVGVSS